MTTAVAAVLAGILGAIIGSFLNVVAYRLPRGESLAHPPSHCPNCGAPVKPYDNVPVLSWLLLRGAARCGADLPALSARGGGTALLCALGGDRQGPEADADLGIVLVLMLVPITVIDLDHRIIPNKITYPGFGRGARVDRRAARPGLARRAPDRLRRRRRLLARRRGRLPGGMGMGDVKLAFVLGLFLARRRARDVHRADRRHGRRRRRHGPQGVAKGRKTAIPFGPYLALGGLVGLFAGDAIVDWYLDTFV